MGRGRQRRRKTVLVAWVLEDAEVDALFVRLHAPRDRMLFRDLDPANEVTLRGRTVSIQSILSVRNYIHLPLSGRQCFLCRPWCQLTLGVSNAAIVSMQLWIGMLQAKVMCWSRVAIDLRVL